MKRLEKLLDTIKEQTHIQDSSSTRGITDTTLVQYFNIANKSLRGLVYTSGFDQYIKSTTLNVVAGQETYSIPSDAFLTSNVLSVEYKWGSDAGDYQKLKKDSIHNRDSSTQGVPKKYIPFGQSFLINPVPTQSVTSGLRVMYEQTLRDLDLRRGVIASTSGSPISSITCDLTPSLDKDSGIVAAGAAELGDADYISVVDKDGTVLMKSIPIDDYDTSTGVITITSGFTPEDGETAPAGAYVVIGKNASTHSEFPDFCENYLLTHVKYLVYRDLGHPDVSYADRELTQHASAILEVFSNANDDITPIHIVDHDHLI